MNSAETIADTYKPFFGGLPWRAARPLGCIFLTLTPITALVLLGYLTRRQHFAALTQWERAGTRRAEATRRPALIFGGGRWLGDLRENVLWGLRALLAGFVVTLPATAPMAIGWHAGWMNSFTKGYEQAAFGPLMSLAGIALFIPLVTALPLLQARYATTGDWRIYLDWRGTRSLAFAAGPGLVLVAAGHLAALLAVTLAQAGLTFAPQLPAFAWLAASDAAAEAFERRWLIAWAFPFTMLVLWAKQRAAISYARAVMRTAPTRLHPAERALCAAAGVEPAAASRILSLVSASTVIISTVLSAGWIVLTYAGQFLNYRGAWGWLNLPPLLLPYLG